MRGQSDAALCGRRLQRRERGGLPLSSGDLAGSVSDNRIGLAGQTAQKDAPAGRAELYEVDGTDRLNLSVVRH